MNSTISEAVEKTANTIGVRYWRLCQQYRKTLIHPVCVNAIYGMEPKVMDRVCPWQIGMVPDTCNIRDYDNILSRDLDYLEMAHVSHRCYKQFYESFALTTFEGMTVRFYADYRAYRHLCNKMRGFDGIYYLAGDSADPMELRNGSGWAVPIAEFTDRATGSVVSYVCCIVEFSTEEGLVKHAHVQFEISSWEQPRFWNEDVE